MLVLALLALSIGVTGCPKPRDVVPNPWLVPFQERHGSAVSRSQMRAMVRLAQMYRERGLKDEYLRALTTAVELYAGDTEVTYQLLNELIGMINKSRSDVSQRKALLSRMGIDASSLSTGSLPADDPARREAQAYLESREKLEALYEETYRILSTACGQIPYNAELYYRTAHLQYLRAEEDGDRDKYKDAINFLKRAIASDSSHLESYHLIALAYERLGDTDRAMRFWRLFEVVYEIAPETVGEGFLTPEREQLHREALRHLESLGAADSTG